MKLISRIILAMLFIGTTAMFYSCHECDCDDTNHVCECDGRNCKCHKSVDPSPEPERKSIGKINIGFGVSLKPDLFELVTPIVTYKGVDGVQHKDRLSPEDCTLDEQDIPLSNGEIYHYEWYHWSPGLQYIMYDDADLDETISVRYESNNKPIDSEREYNLDIDAGIGSVYGSLSYNKNNCLISKDYINLSIKINIGDGQSHSDDIYTGQSVQMYIDELVKTKQDFHIEVSREGVVKINGE